MFRTFYRILPAAILVTMAASFATPARAVTVTYSTTGAFSCGSIAVGCTVTSYNSAQDTIAVTNGGRTETLTFYNNTGTTLGPLPPAQTTNFGDIQACNQDPTNANYIACSAVDPNGVSFNGAVFTLNIDQTAPPSAGGSFNGSLSGNVATAGGTAQVAFSPSALTLGSVTYTLDYNGVFQIPATTSCGADGLCGDEIITGNVNSTAPEPALLGATGLGFVGLLAFRLRRRRSQRASA
jgi:hypothetical protein